MPDRDTALEVGVLGDQAGAPDHPGEVPFGEPSALGDHAKAVSAGGLSRACMFEDLLGLEHRVHRCVGFCVARLRAKAAVLRAAAGFRVHERAHVGAVTEALTAHRPGPLNDLRDLVAIVDAAELERLLEAD